MRDFYDVLDVLGEGSFSTVYLAESLVEKGGYAAIKVIQKVDLKNTKKIPAVDKKRYATLSKLKVLIGVVQFLLYNSTCIPPNL